MTISKFEDRKNRFLIYKMNLIQSRVINEYDHSHTLDSTSYFNFILEIISLSFAKFFELLVKTKIRGIFHIILSYETDYKLSSLDDGQTDRPRLLFSFKSKANLQDVNRDASNQPTATNQFYAMFSTK